MKKVNDIHAIENKCSLLAGFWLHLLEWLRLLVLSLTRIKAFFAGLFFHEPDPPSENYILAETTTKQKIKTQRQTNMKPVNRYIKWGVTLLLVVFAKCATAQSEGPFPLTGNDNVCIGQTKSYGVTENPGSTYSWTITPGAAGTDWVLTPTSASGNTITVQWLTAGTYTLSVTETNSSGCPGDAVPIQITVNPLPVCSITGPNNICPGSSNGYSAPAGMSTYDWSISGDATIVGATNGETVSVLANNICGSFTLTLTITNANGCTSTCNQTFDIKDTEAPVVTGTIAPSTIEGCGPTDAPAAATTVAALEALGIQIADACTPDANLVVTSSDASSGTCPLVITRTYTITDACGNSTTVTQTINVNDTQAPVITCPAAQAFCFDAGNNYTIPVLSATDNCTSNLTITYQVTGATTRSGTGADASGAFGQGVSTITWTVTDACGNTSTCTTTVTINPLPNPVITGEDPVCVSDGTTTVTYTATAGGCDYNWVIPAAGTIVSGQGTNQIIVKWTTPGSMTITVTETACGTGCQGTGSLPVTVTPRPVTSPITHN